MRLYVTARGTWAGTQDDAKALAKADGTSWALEEVPTDKAGLLAFLNGRTAALNTTAALTPPLSQADEAEPIVTQPAPDAKLVEYGLQVRQDIAVEEAIHEADFPRTITLADCIMRRLNEHVRAAERLGK